jgi:hypothetical protein
MSAYFNYEIVEYYDYSTSHMDLKASGTNYLVLITGAGSGTFADTARPYYTIMTVNPRG